MADTTYLEKKGIPTATIGDDKLTDTVGRATARLHCVPGLLFARVPYPICVASDEGELESKVDMLLPQVERILTGSEQEIVGYREPSKV
ncbi:MAG: hypothetical protein HYX92_07940 [Chloroflexi bacterium]|nr:hypothetical protein [Chloroflexota bacterium]